MTTLEDQPHTSGTPTRAGRGTRRPVHTGWTTATTSAAAPAALRGREVAAPVPGVVHTALLAAGLVEDPFLGTREQELTWIGRCDWTWRTSVDVAVDELPRPGERLDLVFDGLDTLARVELNGHELGRTENQHRSHRFDVGALVRPGVNDLVVHFAAPLPEAEARHARSPRPHVNEHPFNALRKTACNFGWDWGPDVVTAGVHGPVGLELVRTARITGVRPVVPVADAAHAHVDVHVDLEVLQPDPRTVQLVVDLAGQRLTRDVTGSGAVVVPVDVEQPQLWWPRGHGEQPLYDLHVEVIDVADPDVAGPDGPEVLDEDHARIGLRTAAFRTDADGGFTLVVNGRDVLVKGVNWIPESPWPVPTPVDRLAARVADATEAGVNLLRVWGGGVYAEEELCRLCDEQGVLLWQDFLFACAAYDEDLLGAEVEAEAREAVTRLARHPSLVVWNGGNENLWGFVDWGWREELQGLSWGEGFYRDLLPRVVADLAPATAYLPGSPFSPDPDAHPNDPATGLVHVWDVWNQCDYTDYATYRPRFASEFGFQAPPTTATWHRAIAPHDRDASSAAVLVHQKAEDGNGKLARGWAPHLPEPGDHDDWLWTAQLNQARAVAFGVEWFRSLHPLCAGTVYWQLNDCWPVVSWSVVDGDGRRKPSWFALARAHRDRTVVLPVDPAAPAGTGSAVVLNDTGDDWDTALHLQRFDREGNVVRTLEVPVHVPARGATRVPLPPEFVVTGTSDGLRASTPDGTIPDGTTPDGTAAHLRGTEDRDLVLPDPQLDVTVEPGGQDDRGGARTVVVVRARTLLVDLTLLPDRLHPDARVDTALLTLLPGETARFTVTAPEPVRVEDVLAPHVLRSANDLVAAARRRGPA